MKDPPFETKGPLLHITTPEFYLYYKPFPFFRLEHDFQQSDKLIDNKLTLIVVFCLSMFLHACDHLMGQAKQKEQEK